MMYWVFFGVGIVVGLALGINLMNLGLKTGWVIYDKPD